MQLMLEKYFLQKNVVLYTACILILFDRWTL